MADNNNNNNNNSINRLHTKIDKLTRQVSRLEKLVGRLQREESGATAACSSGKTRVHQKREAQDDEGKEPPPPTLEVGGRAKILPRATREDPRKKRFVGRTGLVKRMTEKFAWVQVGEETIQRSKKYVEAVV
jgi:hypothetical protein